MAINQLVRATVSNLATYLSAELGANPTNLTESQLETLISTYIALNPNSNVPLSAVTPDFEQNVAELQATLLSDPESPWTEVATAGTGQTLIRFISTAQTYNQLAIELALHEAFPQTAQQANSIYASTRMLGVRIQRRTSAETPVTLNLPINNTGFTIPEYTAFSINGVYQFNRDAITFAAGTITTNAILYEGQVATVSFVSDGSSYQLYTFGNSDFTISDYDIVVSVNGQNWARAIWTANYSVGLWEYGPNDLVYTEATNSEGNVEIQFGNNLNGAIPPNNAIITITYVQTNGLAGNVNLTTQPVTCSSLANVSGVAIGPSVDGSDERDPNDYKILSPAMFAAKYRPTTLQDFNAFCTQYPGVIDAYFEGQSSIAPNDIRYMMVARVTLLTTTTWQPSDFAAFTTWLLGNEKINSPGYAIANMQLITQAAIPEPLNVTVNVYCFDEVQLGVVQNLVIANITALFVPRIGIIGYPIMISDIDNAVQSASNDQIDYYDIVSPTLDMIIGTPQYVTLGSLQVNVYSSTRG